jgi:hypothetical protein
MTVKRPTRSKRRSRLTVTAGGLRWGGAVGRGTAIPPSAREVFLMVTRRWRSSSGVRRSDGALRPLGGRVAWPPSGGRYTSLNTVVTSK